jgi:hypothetical protein
MVTMSRKLQIFEAAALVLILAFVVWVAWSGPDSQFSRLIFDRLWTSLLFALLFLGSIGGLLTLLARMIPKGMSEDGARRWGAIRSKGKASFVRRVSAYFSVPIVLGLAISWFSEATDMNRDPSSIIALPILALVLTGAAIAFAKQQWDENERQYLQKQSQSDAPRDFDGIESSR